MSKQQLGVNLLVEKLDDFFGKSFSKIFQDEIKEAEKLEQENLTQLQSENEKLRIQLNLFKTTKKDDL